MESMKRRIELLAPAGDFEKLETALHFGADAVYFAGKNYGLRAFAGNIEDAELKHAVARVHALGKKAYVTLNIFARNKDFNGLAQYLKILVDAQVDAVIVSDLGVFGFVREHEPTLAIHVSTQANTTNKFSANAWASLGAERIILARELSLGEITEICSSLPQNVEVECFVHGAMCISYSGRCLLSNYLAERDSNHGECVQACRWHYSLVEDSRPNDSLTIEEDSHGAYILNSKDLCLINYLDKLAAAGVTSFKIEGRMKSPYYVATVVNAYRRAIDSLESGKFSVSRELKDELKKASHRAYTTGFTISDKDRIGEEDVEENNNQSNRSTQKYDSSSQEQESVFRAVVLGVEGLNIRVEQRNKFKVGDELEILSPGSDFNKKIKVTKIINSKNVEVDEARLVQEEVTIVADSEYKIMPGDILRSK